MYPKAQKYKFF